MRKILESCTDDKLHKLLEPHKELDFNSCEKYLRSFIESAFEILDPGVRFKSNWHLDYVCEHLELVSKGDIHLLIINIPPAHMKSLMATVCWPVWTWLTNPASRWIFSSYSSDLSTMHSLKRRRIIKSQWFQSRWANRFKLVDDQDRKTIFENDSKGFFMATSTGGTTGGKHGDFLVIDDPINPEHSLSELKRKDGNEHVEYMLATRRRDPSTSRAVLIMQRVHQDDPVAHMEALIDKLGESEKYKVITAQAEAPTKTTIVFPKSNKKVLREEGDVLWKSRFTKSDLDIIRDQLGSYVYSAQYQQTPAPASGGLIDQKWFQYYRELPKDIIRCAYFWDTAIKVKDVNDWSVGILIAECKNGYYALDLVRKRLLYPELKAEIEISFNGSPAQFVVVEDKASGQQIVQELGRNKKFPVLPYEPKGDKVQRLSLVSPIIEAGKFFLPIEAPWTKIFIDEFVYFPHGTFDDCVDATVMGLIYFHLLNKSVSFRGNDQSSKPPLAGSLGGRPKW